MKTLTAQQGACPTCANRVKHVGFDNGGGDFWRCTATPLVPAFTGDHLRRFGPPLVDLRSFNDEHPCHEFQRARSCALWAARNTEAQA